MDWTWRVHDLFWFISIRNYNGFVVDMDSLDQANLHFSKELQWFRGGHGFISSSESSFQPGITIVWEWTWIGHGFSRFDPRYKNKVSVNSWQFQVRRLASEKEPNRHPVLRDEKVLPEVRNRPLLPRDFFGSSILQKLIRIQWGNLPFYHSNIRYTCDSKLQLEKLLELEVGVF